METYKKIDGETIEITSTHKRLEKKKDLLQKKQMLQEEITKIGGKLTILNSGV